MASYVVPILPPVFPKLGETTSLSSVGGQYLTDTWEVQTGTKQMLHAFN